MAGARPFPEREGAVATRLLLVSPSQSLHEMLVRELPRDRFRVWWIRPGAGVLKGVRTSRPHVVVVGGIDARPEAAQLEIALVKALCPRSRVIALSDCSSEADASVVEQGVFYYVAAPAPNELVRAVVLAAEAGDPVPPIR